MAIIRKSLEQISSEVADVDLKKLRLTTEDEIRRHMIENREDPDAPLGDYQPTVLSAVVRQKLGLTQETFAALLHIPIGTIRNWEQKRVKPDPAARASAHPLPAAGSRSQSTAGGLKPFRETGETHGPRPKRRPNHPIGVAAAVMRIAIGQTTEEQEAARSNKRAAAKPAARQPVSASRRRDLTIDR